ncbi:MAG TPA: hypothetical protein VG370_29855 [Chloroflexota bacterium]|jgi:hypothetical protein|nr:hypothetical protein [Chloroflexota bacterium]
MPSRVRIVLGLLSALVLVIAALPGGGQAAGSLKIRLPYVVQTRACPPTGSSYTTIPLEGAPPLDRPIEVHPDFNLAARGWVTVSELRGLVDYNGAFDANSPQLYGLFANLRTPGFTSTHRVNDWDGKNILPPRTDFPVTLLGMATTPGEALLLPGRVPEIYPGYHGLVLYASEVRITWVYTRFGYISSPSGGYGVHVENVCVDPNLLALYRAADAAGRGQLPALRGGQPFGTARSGEILLSIRDSGSFMDPRSRKDWWRGRAALGAESGGQPRPPPPTPTPPTATPTPTPPAPALWS